MNGRTRAIGVLALSVVALGAGRSARQDPALDAMGTMIQEEYRTAALYERLVKDHGTVQPYAGWAETERAHAELIGWLYRDRGRIAPASRWNADAVPARKPLAQACAASLAAEERAVRMYDGYLDTELPHDVRRVFRHNRNVGALQHIPQLRLCALQR